jgi:hypothetical protein
MFHLTERTLSKLLDGTASDRDVERMLRHAGGCRSCGRQLEEWQDNFRELEETYPALATDHGNGRGTGSGGLILVPSDEPHRRMRFDLTTLLWFGAVGMAVVVGYGASRLRHPSDGMDTPPVAIAPARAGATPRPVPPSAPETVLSRPVDPGPSDPPHPLPTPPPARRSPSPASEPGGSVDPPRITRAAPPSAAPAPKPASSAGAKFQAVTLNEASRRLGGPVRTIAGLAPDHIEVGPASGVPGAQPHLDIVRVVYLAGDGQRILLDQQLIPADANGFRPIDDPTLESGLTAYGTAPNGVSVATWLDETGYRLSLAAKVPVDSLKVLAAQVR